MDENIRPLISVIIPLYNAEAYISACLDSVIGQSYENIEILIVDDASTDSGGIICDSYAIRDSRIHVIHLSENRGVSHARNEGIKKSKGSLITFIDADDTVEDTIVERLYENMVQTGSEVSICGFDRIGGNKYTILPEGNSACEFDGRQAIICMFRENPFNWAPWCKLYCRAPVENIMFDEKIHCGEDVLFLYKLLKGTKKVCYIPDRLYHYVFHNDSVTQGDFTEKQYTEFIVYERLTKDAAVNFPEFVIYFEFKILYINVRLAVKAVESPKIKGRRLYRYIRQFHLNTRRYFNWKALSLFKYKKIAAEVLLLYCSTFAFWSITSVYKFLKNLFKR